MKIQSHAFDVAEFYAYFVTVWHDIVIVFDNRIFNLDR